MKKYESSDRGHIAVIEGQIDEVMEEIEQFIRAKITVKDARELEELERKIVELTDRLSCLMLGQKVQGSLDSVELKQESGELAKAHPKLGSQALT